MEWLAALLGVAGKFAWDWSIGKIKDAEKQKEKNIEQKIESIGDGLGSRIGSIENRFKDLEATILEFKKEVRFALQSQRDNSQKIYEGVKDIIRKADDRYDKIYGKVKELEQEVGKVIKLK